MCQPLPGPRCSRHARDILDAKRDARDAAEASRDQTRAAFHACDPTDTDTRERLRDAAVAADKAYWKAQQAHTDALRDYETTPKGMADLEAAAARCEAEGDTRAAAQVRQRLEEAQATRTAQVADLAMSRRHAERLTNATPDELAALDQADAKVRDLDTRVAEKDQTYRNAEAAATALREPVRDADRAEAAATAQLQEAFTEAVTARSAAVREARRLYVEAGISDRFAGYYAQDMAEAASRPTNRGGYRSDYRNSYRSTDEGPLRPLSIKVKRNGPDRDKTLAAKAAAETDEAFQAANTRVAEAIANVHAARASVTDAHAAARPAREAYQQASGAAARAKYELEDTTADRDKAAARAADLRARIGSGLGAGTLRTADMQRVGDEIVRNPDGTTNAYVYNGPSEGFPHGRYIPATGITTVRGMGAANALVLENGRKAWLHGHYARTINGAGESQSGYQTVVLTEPADGATPLRAEGLASAGFYTFVDSTD